MSDGMAWSHEVDGAEFRYYGDVLDEVVAQNVDLHLECMGTGQWWMSLTTADGRRFDVNLGIRQAANSGAVTRFKRPIENFAFHEEDA